MRRGRPTSHKVFGDDFAILAGDALLTQAFYVLATETKNEQWIPRLTAIVADKSGWAGMVGGQIADISSGDIPENQTRGIDSLKFIHLRKTAALISAACECGAICAGADKETQEQYAKMGETLGLAFQIIDDVLDVTADSQTLGKTAGKDERDNKLTYPSILGVEKSRKIALALEEQVMEILNTNASDAHALKELVHKCIHREF
jgi:geranylgeranyl diphosphate synthase type II